MNAPLDTTPLPSAMDVRAPDGSEIRLLTTTSRASMVHCTLAPGEVSRAVRHRTVEEVWYFLAGRGEVWRRFDGQEEVTAVRPGTSLNIPLGADFQFRNPGAEPLVFLIVTMPPWPGEKEAEPVRGHWSGSHRLLD
ncbi:MAG: cupin domain-containing protein [bacterium]